MDYGALRDAWKKRMAAETDEAEKMRQMALEAAKSAAEYLRDRYKARKVFLYGSLAWSKHFTSRSDIDLLVEGCAPDNCWRMIAEVEEITAPFQPSIVFSEDACESLLNKVYCEGIEIQ
jgi:uncharacterized protein